MNKIKKSFVLFSILLPCLLIRCDYDPDRERDCVSAICTTEFRTLTITIKNRSDSTLYHLTDFNVRRVSDNLDITVNHENPSNYSGYYPVTNDSKINLFKNMFVEIEFTGYAANSIVVQKRFIVTADCCHISLVSGTTNFYI